MPHSSAWPAWESRSCTPWSGRDGRKGRERAQAPTVRSPPTSFSGGFTLWPGSSLRSLYSSERVRFLRERVPPTSWHCLGSPFTWFILPRFSVVASPSAGGRTPSQDRPSAEVSVGETFRLVLEFRDFPS